MSDMEGPPLDETTRAFLKRAAREGATAPADSRNRVFARVDAILGPQGPSGGSSGGSSAPALPGLSPTRRAWPLAATFVLGAAAGAMGMRMLSVPVAANPPRIIYVDRATPSPASTVGRIDELTTVPTTSATSGRPPARQPPASDERRNDVGERQLLDVARHALDREDGAATLAAVAEHQRRYPAGVLVQEREAMAVRALVLLGRTDEAQARASRFRSRFPNSVLLPAIESAVGTTSTP
jgi:hypothetical protein